MEKQDEDRNDAELIAAANGGESAAFEALYLRHRDWVVALAYRFTRDEAAACDVLQETFLYFLRKFPGFKLTCQLRTFLYPVVRNLSLTVRRRQERLAPDHPVLETLEADTPRETGASEALRLALALLPEEHRETVWLRYVDELSLQEVAEVLDVPVGTVKSRLHNALTTLRKEQGLRELFGG